MVNNTKVTVIVPTFKPNTYLWECLDSLRKQTLCKDYYELIIVLNGCQDPWEHDIKCYLDKEMCDVRTQFIQTDYPGVSNARNLGLENASGEYIAFIDDDDYVSDRYLEELLRIANNETVGIAYPFAFNDGEPNIQLDYSITREFEKRFKQGKQSHLRTKKLFSGPCMKIFHRDIIGNRRYDIRFKNGEDSLFMFEISDKIKFVNFTTNKAIYFRRYRSGSATTTAYSLLYVLDNCCKRFCVINKIYWSNINKYNFYLYITNILGLLHILLNNIINKIL